MQGLSIRSVMVMVILSALMGGAFAAAPATAGKRVECAGTSCAVGLVMDRRGNLYVASRKTGCVFCLPPASAPVLLARVPGTPTCLAVDPVLTVFVGTESGVVYGVASDGSVTEACRVGSPARGIVVDRDGGLLVATGHGVVVRFDRAKVGR